MNISVLTFNLEYNRGFPKLMNVIDKYKPDIVAIQEFDLSEDSQMLIEKRGYKLGDYAESFKKYSQMFGVATFYNHTKLEKMSSQTIHLPRGLYEIFWLIVGTSPRRTVVSTHYKIKRTDRNLHIYNVHFTPIARNALREKQLHKILKKAEEHDEPTVVLGDFNYPYRRGRLEKVFRKYSFEEATTNVFHTFFKTLRFLPIRFKLDYVLYSHLVHKQTKKIDAFSTDHTPLIATFSV